MLRQNFTYLCLSFSVMLSTVLPGALAAPSGNSSVNGSAAANSQPATGKKGSNPAVATEKKPSPSVKAANPNPVGAGSQPASGNKTADAKKAQTSKPAVTTATKPASQAKQAANPNPVGAGSQPVSGNKSGDGKKSSGAAPVSAKTAESKKAVKIERAEARERHALGLVPPPPPETPTVLSPLGMGQSYMQQLVPLEMLSLDSLKQRRQDLTSQLQTAQNELKDKTAGLSDKTTRGKQFQALYDEGVISRRELEFALDDSKQAQSTIDSSKSKVQDLQTALNRVDAKLKALGKLGLGNRKTASAKSKIKAHTQEHKTLAKANPTKTTDTQTALKPAAPTASSAPDTSATSTSQAAPPHSSAPTSAAASAPTAVPASAPTTAPTAPSSPSSATNASP
jgi:hypothetical protein